eukprot:GHVH01006218.1.p1 GENE.GHVH01006218.1~~GHVH01006218.1.p1  ORF type:complete len:407 (+),score=52.87 GHVH01006218.1:179-1399(+)
MKELLIGCVGKPSSGKSTFFNAVVEQCSAKMGAYPFTTIEPNRGVAFYHTECPCKKFAVECDPIEGICEDGIRKVPVNLLDIAGLIPNAHAGEGLGNKFLDDIRLADVLLHIVDISGTTNAKGEETVGYDPTGDHQWLMSEITEWIFNNLWGHWQSIVRKSSSGTTDGLKVLHEKLSGYNCKINTVKETLQKCGYFGLVDFSLWTRDDVHRFCETFVDVRFPTVLVLNKSEKGVGGSDVNVVRMTRKFPSVPVIMASAKSEVQLRELSREGYIDYNSLTGKVELLKDVPDREEFEFIQDFVLFRCSSAGCQQAIQAAINLINRRVIYPVDSLVAIRNQKGPSFSRSILVSGDVTIKELTVGLSSHDGVGVIAESVDGARFTAEDKVERIMSPAVVRISVGTKSIFE